MTLSFSTKWHKPMGDLAGQPNYFVEKIWTGLPYDTNPDYYCFVEEYLDRFGELWDGAWTEDTETNFHPKLHTIREDKGNRWKAGTDIHFVINNRTMNRFQFAPVMKCVSVQRIRIIWQIDRTYLPLVAVGSKLLCLESIERLAINDGFDSVEDFFAYFNTDFKGKIIHWTDLKY